MGYYVTTYCTFAFEKACYIVGAITTMKIKHIERRQIEREKSEQEKNKPEQLKSEQKPKVTLKRTKNTVKNGKYKNDIILAVGLLLGALCLWCVIFLLQRSRGQDGLMVVVTVDGEEYYSGPLESDAEGIENNSGFFGEHSEDVDGKDKKAEKNVRVIDINGHNKVVIYDGEVRMEEADCPDKLCVLQGKISRSGQTIICLPNKVMVTIKGGKSEYDGVVK